MTNYNLHLESLKTQILLDIKNLLPSGSSHTFRETFYCVELGHDCQRFPTVSDKLTNNGGTLILHNVDDVEAPIRDEYDDELSKFEISTIIYTYEQLCKELREDKLNELRKLLSSVNDDLECDGSFGFHELVDPQKDRDYVCGELTKVKGISIAGSGDICIDWAENGRSGFSHIDTVPDDELDALIKYVKTQVKREFKFKFYGAFTYEIEVEGKSAEDAQAQAMAMFQNEEFFPYVDDFECTQC